ncbi:MAG: hypothetical protein HFI62_06275 [Lachnospiraceae bacterium]|nr:hypothetical protein [Lachnospiraceae bacterium]
MDREKKRALCILAALLVFFMTMLAACGVGVYNDSEQYITMHIHREPLYPLFLWCFRGVIGEGYLPVAMAVQGILTAFGITVLSEYLTRRFQLRLWEEVLVVFLQLVPHLMTRYVSALHIFLENSVMSEALCIPLFQFFLYFLLRMVFEGKRRDRVLSLIMAFLLSMTRGQMMTTILMWALIFMIQLLIRRNYRAMVIPLATLLVVFGLRSLTVHVYNYFVTGYFMGNTYGQVNTLTNVIYACDEEDREVFGEGSLEQAFFDQFYDEADALGLNYKYAGNTFGERAAYLEEHHDILKFQVLEADMSSYFFGLGKVDYYQQSSMSDEMAGRMIRKLLPACFGQWLYDYVLLCRNGFVRSIAVVHPLINWAAFMIYLAAAGISLYLMIAKRRFEAPLAMGVALLFIAANVCATSITIMCLSRYMIYGFSIFYIAFYLAVREIYYQIKENK